MATSLRTLLAGQKASIMGPLLVGSLMINLLGLALPLAALQVYDRVLARHATVSWVMLCLLVLGAAVIELILRGARARLMIWHGIRQEQLLAARQLHHQLRVGPHPNVSTGTQLQLLEIPAKLREFTSGQALTIMLEIPFLLVYLGLITFLGGWLVLIPLGLLLIFAGRTLGQGQALRTRLTELQTADATRLAGLIDLLERIHTLKAFAALRRLQRQAEARQQHGAQAAWRVALAGNLTYQDGLTFGQLMLAALVMAGTPLAVSGQLSLGSLMACVLLGGRLMAPVQRGLGFYTRVQEAGLAMHKLRQGFARPVMFAGTATAGPAEGDLRVEDLRLSGNLGQDGALAPINLTLQRGQSVALQIDDAAAAEALMHTLAGLHAPAAGQVRLDGVAPHMLTAEDLVRHVGYLAPNGSIYHGTIYENLSRFGQTPHAQVMELTRLLGLDEAIARLPHGYETPLENTLADPLPPGMKQRLAMARVLAVKPRLILFHQADRALDRAGYNHVYSLLSRIRRQATLVLLTRDQNLCALVDRTLVLDTTIATGRADAPLLRRAA